MAKTLHLDPFPCVLTFHAGEYDDKIGITESAGPCIVVSINKKNSPQEMLEAAVHEAVHVSQAVQEYVEVQFDDETEAYMIQKTAVWLLEQIKKIKTRRKRSAAQTTMKE